MIQKIEHIEANKKNEKNLRSKKKDTINKCMHGIKLLSSSPSANERKKRRMQKEVVRDLLFSFLFILLLLSLTYLLEN